MIAFDAPPKKAYLSKIFEERYEILLHSILPDNAVIVSKLPSRSPRSPPPLPAPLPPLLSPLLSPLVLLGAEEAGHLGIVYFLVRL